MRDIFEIKDNFSLYNDVESVFEWGDTEKCPNPKVSIVIPCYNHPKFFRKALQSALSQDYQGEYEIVVVDNDDSKEITSNREIVEEHDSPNVLYYHNKKNIGMFGNWNRCIELARAPYLTFLHDDDMLLPTCLTTLMKYAKNNSKKAVLGLYNYIDENDAITYTSPFEGRKGLLKYRRFRKYQLINHFISPMGYCIGTLFQKGGIMAIGGFSPDFYPSADAALISLYIKTFGAIQPLKATHNYRLAENESFQIYSQFAPCIRHIRECMKPYIKCPNFLLDIIIKAMYSTSAYSLEQSMGNGKHHVKVPSRFERKITNICCHIEGLSKYTLF